MSVQSQDIEYSFDGIRLVGELSADDASGEPRPAILVCHEGNGLSDHAKNVARKLAGLGYVAFALDYYGDGKPLPDDQIMARYSELAGDPERTRGIARAGLDVLLADRPRRPQPGGVDRLLLRRHDVARARPRRHRPGVRRRVPLRAGHVPAGRRRATSRPSVLVNIGTEDPLIPPDQRTAFEQEMRAAGADWRMYLYGGAVHSFTNPAADGSNPAIKYDAVADARSWRAMLDLFGEVF